MDEAVVLEIAAMAMTATAKLAAPVLLVSLAIGLWVDQLITDLFSRQDWLGWLALGLTALLIVAAFAMVMREVWGLLRMARVGSLRADGEAAAKEDNAIS